MKTAVILMNLGSPQQPTPRYIRAFLREFLSDRRIVEVPKWIWYCILYGIVLPLRVPRVAKAYQKIWWSEGSPLRVITQQQVANLTAYLHSQLGDSAPLVRYAMTYAGPSLAEVVHVLKAEGVDHILVLPLYPQYSATTVGSIYDQYAQLILTSRDIPQLFLVKAYFDNPLYIEALANSVRQSWQQQGRGERLLMTFHSIPQSYSDKGDPYYHQCLSTARLLAEKLDLRDGEWEVSFQSRIGFSKWLSPYTSVRVKELAAENIKSLDVVCPAFAADCLETLEEIQVENREIFLANGGERFAVVPCLNASDDHIAMMALLVNKYMPKV